ncbi:MAG: phage tail family protein [Neisseriaceae bacterium]|nr:phage tail family protein [Neisseriaceae bacterium]
MYAYKLYVYNERLVGWYDLTGQPAYFSILRVDGLNPPAANINTSTGGTLDGTFFNSGRLGQRNIVVTFMPHGDIEVNRQRLYQLFPVNQEIQLRFKNGNRDVIITGYVESFEGSLCDFPQTFTVSIICPRPFWKDHTISTATLPSESAAIRNSGDIKNGVNIRINISSELSHEAVRDLTITNYLTGEYIGFTSGFIHDDTIVISTIAGELMAEVRRTSLPKPVNLLRYMSDGSSWLKLKFGDNAFSFTTSNNTEQYVSIQIQHTNQYYGV